MTSTYSNLVKIYELMVIQSYAKEQEKTKRTQTKTVKIGKSVWCIVCRGQDNLVKLRYESDNTADASQDTLIENYIEMIYNCFNIEIVDEEGGGCICETCIMRLRDALDFKTSVSKAEEVLLEPDLYHNEDIDKVAENKPKKSNKTKTSSQQEFEILPPRLKSGTNRCPVCGQVHFNNSTLRSHYMAHFHPCHVCGECGKRYITLKQLNQHVRTFHKDKRHVCQVCSKSFSTAQVLDEHVKKIHEKIREYKCEVCSKSFYTLDDRRKHKIKMHKEQSHIYPCNVCNRIFSSVSGVRYHIKTAHTSVEEFACPDCDYKCSDASILEQHKTVHS